MPNPNDTSEKTTLADEAVEWFVRLDANNLNEEERRAFAAWRTQSAAHQQAFDEVAGLWQTCDRLPDKPQVHTNPSLPLQYECHSEPFASAQDTLHAASLPQPRRIPPRWAWGSALAVVLCVAVIWTTDLMTLWHADYRTGIGEVQTVILEDGSTMSLNTNSAVAIDLLPGRRRVTVLKGEALFIVAPDTTRPFRVIAGDGISTALGTAFSVRQRGGGTVITVLESRVAVTYPQRTDAQTKAATVTLSRGQQVRYSSTEGLGQIAAVDPQSVTAWRHGKIIFEARPLGEVIDELNRYHVGHIQIIDPHIRELRVNGVFETADPTGVIDALEHSLPVRSTRLTNWLILLHR
jgi:transmembrane sensor